MDEYPLIISLAVAMGTGLLIGLQREHSANILQRNHAQDGQKHPRVDITFIGGIRTYPLFSIAGALSALAAKAFGMWIVAAALIALTVPVAIAYADGIRRGGDRGITSETALVVTFLLGVLSVSNEFVSQLGARLLLVSGIAVVVTGILALKEPLHSLASKFSPDDMYTTVKFLVLAVIVLPLLPNQDMGPLDALNPFKIGLMVVFLAGMGLAGYVLARILGPQRGIGLAGLVGGIASSTAVTASVAGEARREPKCFNACLVAVVLASAAMPVRLIIEVAAVNTPMASYVTPPMVAMTIAGLAIGYYLYRRHPEEKSQDIELHNPLELRTALYFGILFAIIMPGSKWAIIHLGNRGMYMSAALSGLLDLDAITISIAGMAHGQVATPWSATAAILVAVASNTAIKAGLAVAIGGLSFGWRVLVAFVLIILAGGAALAAAKMFV
jgi:uncharacterized membrane protein (DUF4010 family)